MDENTMMLIERMNTLEMENNQLREDLDALKDKNQEIYEKFKNSIHGCDEALNDLYNSY